MRMGGSYDLRYIKGSEFTCPKCGHQWGFANVTPAQARREKLDKCPQCGGPGQGKAIKTTL